MSQQILPFYLVCDESSSMMGGPIDAINKSLPVLHQEIGSNPVVADKTRFALISFNHQAQVLLPLSDLSIVSSVPSLTASGGTDYEVAFNLLYDTISQDVAKLKADGHQVLRPAVFFLTDGQPNPNNWVAAYQRLTDPAWGLRPNILAFGFGEADSAIIQQVATVLGFVADGSLGPAGALQEFAQSLIQSIVSSGTSADANGGMSLSAPEKVSGFRTVPADVV
ncbi:vWA domain-containing protein [Sphaerimonospora thailandensis]|uniref:VWFA domain-containing protein n=1 Tax=Sphaerimonospora thailandensis TaxID=795644 RepID=A0A8J3W147_9ACTN|nr:VWA domain-containing protein [Sphaerimonospora thailandensis]GIH72317.1 hypothetical protein Mth01_45700 [Sphaerimonospora thailandensis]